MLATTETNARLCLDTFQMMAPNRRPSADPSPTATPSSTAETAAETTALNKRGSLRRRSRRHSCTQQWRSNTYNGTDELQQQQHYQHGSSNETISDCDQREEGIVTMANGRQLPSTPTRTILCLREAMRELARSQMHLCIGGVGGCGGSSSAPSSSNTLSVVGIAGNASAVSSTLQLQQRQQRRTSAAYGGAGVGDSTGTMAPPIVATTRSASVCCYPSPMVAQQQQQIIRRCSTTTKSGRLERSNSLIAGRGSATLAFLPELNPQQVANLRRTWKHINTKGLYDIIRRSFRKVESAHSSVAMAFRQSGTSSVSADGTKHSARADDSATAGAGANNDKVPPQTKFCGVMEHSKYFMVLLNRIIDGENNQDIQDLERELKQIGARHVIVYKRFGVGVTEIERTGEALAESLFKLDGIRQSKETTKVWRVLIAKIVDHIETGFRDELRSQRRRTSSALLSSAAGALAAPFFEDNNKFVKRNSMPTPHNNSADQQQRQASNEEDDDVIIDNAGTITSTSASSKTKAVAVPKSSQSLRSADGTLPHQHQQQQRQQTSASVSTSTGGGGGFLRAELAGVVRRLSNL